MKSKKKILFTLSIVLIFFLCLFTSQVQATEENSSGCLYLSDIDYITTNNWSYAGWGSIQKDKNVDGGTIKLRVDDELVPYSKGMAVHAKGQLTYDVSQYSNTLTRLIATVGVDASKNSESSLWFEFSVSNDGNSWTKLHKTKNLSAPNNAEPIDINISGYKYLRIYVDPMGSNAKDHGVLGDAKLVSADYDPNNIAYDKLHKVQYYDDILKEHDAEYNYENNYRLVLEREFVNKIGFWTIQDLARFNPDTKETIEWILSSNENLEQVIEVGEIGDGGNFIKVLNNLYKENKDSLQEENGYVYQKMMIGLTAAYTTDRVSSGLAFSHQTPSYDYVERFKIIKELLDGGLLPYGTQFKDYHVELMRAVMSDGARNDEIRWLNYYTKSKNNNQSVYAYVNHTGSSVSYNIPQFFDAAYKEEQESKWHLSEYGVPFGDTYRYWMVISRGGICWNQSRVFQSLFNSIGSPTIGAYQPGHEVSFYYIPNADGTGSWGMANNIFGWGQTSTTWYGGNRFRTIFDWANKSFTNQPVNNNGGGTSGGYVYLAQANLNRYDDYKKSLYLNLIANSYENLDTKVETYNKALELSEINLDSYDYIIQNYKKLNKTSTEWHALAEKIIDVYTFYPMAMNDLLKVIKPYLGGTDRIDIDQKEYAALQRASKATNQDIWQDGACRDIAKVLLNRTSAKLASFSFDGDNANKIVIESPYNGYDIAWRYSLDGGTTKSDAITNNSYELKKEEISKINIDNDIKIYLDGLVQNEPTYTIDITESAGLPSSLYANDLENKLIASVSQMEWKFNEEDEWTSFADEEPDLTGDKNLIVRMGATGTRIYSAPREYQFTNDVVDKKTQYISIAHLSIHDYSTQSKDSGRPFYAPNAIDGNLNTLWHTDFAQNVLQSTIKPYITIKIDSPKNISALEFIQKKYPGKPNDPDNIKNARVYVSIDGEYWTEAGKIENCITYGQLYKISFDESAYGQYVKLEMDTTSMFASVAMINLYEDTTVKTVASFSFDGENAGTISLFDEFAGQSWKYSVDGGETWKDADANNHKLNSEELEQINPENNIRIKFDGDETIYFIYIKKGSTPTITPYVSDLENRLLGLYDSTSGLEWKIEGEDTWTPYTEDEPIVKGNKKLFVRRMATGVFTASDALEYQFTEDNQSDTRRYVSVLHQSVYEVSSQENNNAKYAIDANENTRWHSAFDGSDKDKYYIIKLDEPKYISSLEYVPATTGGTNGRAESVQILVSMDGENWTEVVSETNWTYINDSDRSRKSVDFTPTEAQYVKIVGKRTQTTDSSKSFMTASIFSLYEDITKREATIPTADVLYSTTDPTNQDVVATLVNPSTDITITNNEGNNKYTFAENGSFTFEFEDEAGNKGTTTATVDWIDKVNPTVEFEYSTRDNTINPVVVTLKPSEEITILNKDLEYTENEDGTYSIVFDKNTTYTFEFEDKVGNKGTAEVVIDWIKDPTIVSVSYDITTLTNEDVTVTIEAENNVKIKITNNNGSNKYTFTENGEFTFEFTDEYGISKTKIVKVDWIDKDVPTAEISYSTTTDTLDPVTVTLNPSEKITILNEDLEYTKNEDGTYSIVFDQNTTYTIYFVDEAGNEGEAVAIIDWIKEKTEVSLSYSTEKWTNQDVEVTLTANNEITIDNNNGSNKYTFTENGDFTFEYTDKYRISGSITVTVDWIDKDAPTAEIEYSTKENTINPVIATLIPSEEVTIEDGKDTYVFDKNGSFTFKFVDRAGNEGTATATVNWIKKIPGLNLVYDITEMTKENVEVKLVTTNDVNIKITNNNESNTYVFTDNGDFTFEYEDESGESGSITARVDWIDKTNPTAEVSYSTTQPTNKDVIATLKFSEEVTILNENLEFTKNEDGTYSIVFDKNTELELQFEDKVGNIGTEEINIGWIDKDMPTADFEFSTRDITENPVTVTLKPSEKVTILNNDGSDTYTFDKNGEFTFEFKDEAGNINTATVNVNWIRKAPKLTLEYSPYTYTNSDVIVTLIDYDENNVNVINNNGSKQYIFKTNESFTFEYIDEYGIAGSITATVDWIDKDDPTVELYQNIYNKTNEDVVVTMKFNEIVTILYTDLDIENKGNNTYEVKVAENGTYVVEYMDKAGNKCTTTVAINNIDRDVPTAEVSYSTEEATNEDVTVTIKFNEEVRILTENLEIENKGNNTYEIKFAENGTYEVEFRDEAGNIGTTTIEVTNIDKKAPTAEVSYSTTEITNKDVIATIVFDKGNVTVEGGNTHIFTENGEHIFKYTDEKGNTGTATANVTWIDKVAPTATVEYDIKEETTGSVVASLVNESEEIIITNNDGKNTYTFEANGSFTFEFVDKAGNTGTATATVDWIKEENPDDPKPPVKNPSFEIILTPSKEELNPGEEFEIDVKINNLKDIENGLCAIAGQLEYDNEIIEVLEIKGQSNWNMDENSFNNDNFKFITENGEYISESGTIITIKAKIKENVEAPVDANFKMKSIVGSNAEIDIDAKDVEISLHIVESIADEPKITSDIYRTEENIISRILPETTVSEFKENITANREFTITDEEGNVLEDDDIIKTGMTVKVGENELQFTLVVIGDINKDGQLGITDLAQMKLNIIEKEVLTGARLKAADINGDGEVTITDLAQIKLIIIGLKEVK